MKYVNQISFFLALAGVFIVIFTFSSTYMERTDFEPITVEPAEIDKPAARTTAPAGFTANRQAGPEQSMNQFPARSNVAGGRVPASAERESPLMAQPRTSRANTTTNRRSQPSTNRVLIPQNQLPNRQRSTEMSEPNNNRSRGPSAIVGAPTRASRRPPSSNPANTPLGRTVQKRDSGSNPQPPPPRGSLQRTRPPN